MAVSDELASEAATCADRDRLQALAGHRWTAVRAAVAENPATPADVLVQLVQDRSHLARFGVAQNPSPTAVEIALAATDTDVRVVLAQRLDLSDQVYEALLEDIDHTVRSSLASSTDRQHLLARLANDPHERVRGAISHNRACTQELLEMLSRDRSNQVRASVATTDLVTEEMLQRLARDKSASVRWWVIHRHWHRRDVVKLLADDPDEENAKAARSVLKDLPFRRRRWPRPDVPKSPGKR